MTENKALRWVGGILAVVILVLAGLGFPEESVRLAEILATQVQETLMPTPEPVTITPPPPTVEITTNTPIPPSDDECLVPVIAADVDDRDMRVYENPGYPATIMRVLDVGEIVHVITMVEKDQHLWAGEAVGGFVPFSAAFTPLDYEPCQDLLPITPTAPPPGEEQYCTKSDWTNLRSSPTIANNIVGKLTSDQWVTRLGPEQNGWWYVERNDGFKAWVASWVLKLCN